MLLGMKQTPEELLKDLTARFEELKNERIKFQPRWTEAQEFVDSAILDWNTLGTVPKAPNRYSSLPCNYLNVLVNGLVGYSISPNIVWFKLSLQDQTALNLYGVKDWLETCEEIMLAKFNASNLYTQAAKFISDAAVIGHGVMLIDEDIKQQRLRYTKLPANEIYLDINEYGEVDTVYRRYNMTVRNCISFFGEDKVDTKVREDYKDPKKWNNPVEIIQAVFPRQDYNPEYKDATNKPVAVFWIDNTNHKIIDESGYDDIPYAVFYWDRYPGFAYGSSPAQNAICDIKGLNIAKKTSWTIAQTSAEPPMKISEDIREVNITPRGHTYITSADQIIEPIRTGENYPITLEVLEGMKQDIKDWFNVDFFLMLQQKTAQMTATEVMELQGEKAATLSNLIVNLNEALLKIIQRSFEILYNAGEFPEVPVALQEAGFGGGMKVDFVGPLAQAQKKYHTMGGTAQALNIAGPIMQMFPNAADFIDGDVLMKAALEGQGMPQRVIREEDDVKKLRQERAIAQQEQQALMQQQQMAQTLMQNANKMNEPIQRGSVMDELNNQMAGAYR